MPLDYSDPHVLRFITEFFVRENKQRVSWFLKNKEKIIKYATSRKENVVTEKDVTLFNIENCIGSLAMHHKTSSANRRKTPIRDGPVLGASEIKVTTTPVIAELIDINDTAFKRTNNDFKLDPIMRPVNPEVTKILYEPLPNGGRREYLKARKRKIPEDKYYFSETSNSTIGWRCKDSELGCKAPKYGRRFNLKHELKNRSGAQPDPKHYQKPLQNPFSKC